MRKGKTFYRGFGPGEKASPVDGSSARESELLIGARGLAGISTCDGHYATALGRLVRVPVIDLDLLDWEENGYGRKRDEDSSTENSSHMA
jgi:hypothetical protein